MIPAGKAHDFRVRLPLPLNAGPQVRHLGQSFVTPHEQFFVRNHGDVPILDPQRYRLRIEGEVRQPFHLSLRELKERFPVRQVTATLQCAGNRRQELMAAKPIDGELGWGAEAIGTAVWTGVRLADVLALAQVSGEARHVELAGHDRTQREGGSWSFGGSIPIDKALAPEVLLAWGMNGAPLAPLHGAPLRLVVPGYVGARSVKWLEAVRLRRDPSENYFQAHAYRLFGPETDPGNVVWEEGEMLGEIPLTSIITSPAPEAQLLPGRTVIEGVALAPCGLSLDRVEVSADGGTSWHAARIAESAEPWAWRPWWLVLDLPEGRHEIVARAWDSEGRTQPQHPRDVWNFKGYLNNSWPRVAVRCE